MIRSLVLFMTFFMISGYSNGEVFFGGNECMYKPMNLTPSTGYLCCTMIPGEKFPIHGNITVHALNTSRPFKMFAWQMKLPKGQPTICPPQEWEMSMMGQFYPNITYKIQYEWTIPNSFITSIGFLAKCDGNCIIQARDIVIR